MGWMAYPQMARHSSLPKCAWQTRDRLTEDGVAYNGAYGLSGEEYAGWGDADAICIALPSSTQYTGGTCSLVPLKELLGEPPCRPSCLLQLSLLPRNRWTPCCASYCLFRA